MSGDESNDKDDEGTVEGKPITAMPAAEDREVMCYVVVYTNGFQRRVFSLENLAELKQRIATEVGRRTGKPCYLQVPERDRLAAPELDEDDKPVVVDGKPVMFFYPSAMIRADLILDVTEYDEDELWAEFPITLEERQLAALRDDDEDEEEAPPKKPEVKKPSIPPSAFKRPAGTTKPAGAPPKAPIHMAPGAAPPRPRPTHTPT